ncbi:MAG TPA: SRPBCC domain-containing protein [Acidimicrobiales bacterium]|nr:SRPBCC domain-containing protein [Acidimicrobiales bacterium]
MELGSIEREIHIQASPATVFEVITSPQHLREWWPDDAVIEPRPGARGELVFGDRSSPDVQIPQVTVVDAVPDRLFSFRWTHPVGEEARDGNSLLVTFELTPSGGGTLLRMTETGFREMGWEVAVLEQQYCEHVEGWDHFLPRLVAYAPSVRVTS